VPPDKTLRERAEDLIRLVVPDWRPTPRQGLWAIRIVFWVVIVLSILTLVGRPFDITLWQWLDLLIIPVVLAIGGYLFTRSENRAALLVAEQRTQDEALQAYLDQMGQMLIDKDRPLRQSDEDDDVHTLGVQTLARARTLTVLTRLDGNRKRSVLRFLYESQVINKDRRVVNLTEADLSGAKLSFALWTYIDLSGTDLSGTILHGANLNSTDLSGANFRFARGITAEELEQQSVSLEGATMPNGQKYEDWRRDREGGKQNE
jgi:hypothetical protein